MANLCKKKILCWNSLWTLGNILYNNKKNIAEHITSNFIGRENYITYSWYFLITSQYLIAAHFWNFLGLWIFEISIKKSCICQVGYLVISTSDNNGFIDPAWMLTIINSTLEISRVQKYGLKQTFWTCDKCGFESSTNILYIDER